MQRANIDRERWRNLDTDLRNHLIWHEHSDHKLDAILEYVKDIPAMKTDIAGLKSDVHDVRFDVEVLKTDVAELKTDVAVLKSDVAELKTDVKGVKGRLDRLAPGK